MKNFLKEFYKKITKKLQNNFTNEFEKDQKINYKNFQKEDTPRYSGMKIKLAKISENFR